MIFFFKRKKRLPNITCIYAVEKKWY